MSAQSHPRRSPFAKVSLIDTAQSVRAALAGPERQAVLSWLLEAPPAVVDHLRAVADLPPWHRPYLINLWAGLVGNAAAFAWLEAHGEDWLSRAPQPARSR